MKGNMIMTIINNILTGIQRGNENSPVQSNRLTIEPDKLYEESQDKTKLAEGVHIDFSDESKEAFSILDYMDDLPDVREEKVAEIKQQFKDDAYIFDYDQIASNMIDAFMNERL